MVIHSSLVNSQAAAVQTYPGLPPVEVTEVDEFPTSLSYPKYTKNLVMGTKPLPVQLEYSIHQSSICNYFSSTLIDYIFCVWVEAATRYVFSSWAHLAAELQSWS